ncbi:divalent cation transporter [Methylophaga sp. SB9B]|uniref:ZIP family metal transporter n=1 Tax=Methylophaga sp. SB9B TaxID=2570356 RepID=UPI0010A8FB0D|nr:divalent cation transporter [Methylophaga sp. SB9B]THK42393.1 divalent cation transporter [Methylophaga sp. SB9B]
MDNTTVLQIVLLTMAAGICIPVGGFVASFERVHSQWLEKELRHFIIALGGGILLGAVMLVLVPEGLENMGDSVWNILFIVAGGLAFFYIERLLGLHKNESPQLMGMILDYVPEAIALGGLMALNPASGPLLALLIGLQNLPEGFNAYRELKQHNRHSNVLSKMTLFVALGPIAGLAGYFFLSEHPAILGAIMLFASGGILYLVFQDIAPQSKLARHWAPPLGAVFGFCLALFSHLLLVHY